MKKKKNVLSVYLILCLCFIWGQSALPRTESSGESSFVLYQVIHPMEEALFGRVSSTEEQVRKAAHVFEYTMLGMGLAAYFSPGGEVRRTVFRSCSAGLFAALIDETIQIFSGRGPMIRDVWIDGIGVLQGTVLVLLWLWLREKRKQEQEKK